MCCVWRDFGDEFVRPHFFHPTDWVCFGVVGLSVYCLRTNRGPSPFKCYIYYTCLGICLRYPLGIEGLFQGKNGVDITEALTCVNAFFCHNVSLRGMPAFNCFCPRKHACRFPPRYWFVGSGTQICAPCSILCLSSRVIFWGIQLFAGTKHRSACVLFCHE